MKRVAPRGGLRGAKVTICVPSGPNGSRPARVLSSHAADDFKHGFHLEVGEPTSKRRVFTTRTARRHAHQMTSRLSLRKQGASVGRDKAGVLYFEHIEVDGMSGYPHQKISIPLSTYPEPGMGG